MSAAPKTRPPKTQIITANALIEGDVVYLAANGLWTRHLTEAQVFADAEAADAALSAASKRVDEIVGCYLTEVRQTAHGIEPAHFREDFRRRGPSNYAHGKQAAA